MTTKMKTDAGEPGAIAGTPRMESLAQIKPAAWNPRQRRDAKADAELVESVKQQGVLQSLLVRPVNSHFEVVCGTRRYDAALEAGLCAVPVIVRELDDVEVLELQTIENSQREDVHPLEEAEAYRKLRDEHHASPEEIAVKVGKSRTWVYSRIKLCALGDAARKAFLDGKLDASTALLVARIPDPELQKKATVELTRANYDGSLMSYRQAAEYVQTHYMLKLAEAGFKTTDADLVPEAGPCTTCPKRTGSQRELFADVKSADVCTDPRCYRQKQDASFEARAAAADAAGQRVLQASETKAIFDNYSHDEVSSRSAYIDLDAKEYVGDKEKPWRQILGKDAPTPILAQDPRGGVHELVPRAAVAELLKESGKKVGYGEFAGQKGRQTSASEARKRDEQKRRKETARRVLAAIAAVAEQFSVQNREALDAFMRFVIEAFLKSGWHDTLVEVAKRRALPLSKPKGGYNAEANDCIREAAHLAQGAELRGLVVEIIATSGSYSTWNTEPGPLLREACALLGLDRKALEAAARKELAAEEKPAKKAAPAKKPAAKQPAKKGSRK